MMIRRFHEGKLVERNSPLPLVFIHINKTAGTTFAQILFRLFEKSQIATPYRGDMTAIGVGDPNLRLFHGHLRHADWFRHGTPALSICMLRDPRARIVSQYKSFKALRNIEDANRWKDIARGAQALELARNSTFDEFLLSDLPMVRGHLDNLQVQFLSDSGVARSARDADTAIANLTKHMFYFGITEQFDASAALLARQLRIERPTDTEQKNVSEAEEIEAQSPEAQARLADYSALDQQLYDAALPLFQARCQTAGITS